MQIFFGPGFLLHVLITFEDDSSNLQGERWGEGGGRELSFGRPESQLLSKKFGKAGNWCHSDFVTRNSCALTFD
jgi:hypothetical protein